MGTNFLEAEPSGTCNSESHRTQMLVRPSDNSKIGKTLCGVTGDAGRSDGKKSGGKEIQWWTGKKVTIEVEEDVKENPMRWWREGSRDEPKGTWNIGGS